MPGKHVVRYVVEGRGEFPLDMLRRDDARAASEADRALTEGGREALGRYRVHLVSEARGAPVTARWESFGWRVVECSDPSLLSGPVRGRPRLHPEGATAADRVRASDAALALEGGVRRTMRLDAATVAAMERIKAARGDRSDTALVARLIAEEAAGLDEPGEGDRAPRKSRIAR